MCGGGTGVQAGMCGLLCGPVRACAAARGHVPPRATNVGMCGHVRPPAMGCAGMCGGGTGVQAGMCSLLCGPVRACAAARGPWLPSCHERCHVQACTGAMCGHVRAEPEPAALAWAPNASPKRRPYCTRVSAHATHMGAQSQTSSHGEDRMGTSVKNSEHMPPHMPAHTRASIDRCAPAAGTPAHAGHMPRTCPHNERTCRTKNAGT